uniref:EOG090X0D2W n=1 Tax=Evadne anonyx TaxID=141404 RepID=A0A9N6WSE0_9CRUS|nr:EOG090X0D2W [Evadne anonyx]
MDNEGEKKYGLILPSKKNFKSPFLSSAAGATKPKIFTENSSSDDNLDKEEEEVETALDWRSRTAAKATEKSVQRNQARQAALKALEEDPTIFQYDEIYDEIKEKKEQAKPAPAEKKPKYIKQLLRSAEQRKLETERRTERKIQKERDNEGDEFKDKESFITPAYQAKLQERKEQEEEECMKEQMEAALDVTKQRDLGGFYRHMYNQTFAEKTEKAEKVEKKEVSASFRKDAVDLDAKNRRHYRQRREDSPEPLASEPMETEPVEDVEQEVEENEENVEKQPLPKREIREAASATLISAAAIDRAAAVQRAEKAAEKMVEQAESSSDESETLMNDVKETVKMVPKVKIDIWKKRTTDQLFDEALERYQLRKEAREQGLVRWP